MPRTIHALSFPVIARIPPIEDQPPLAPEVQQNVDMYTAYVAALAHSTRRVGSRKEYEAQVAVNRQTSRAPLIVLHAILETMTVSDTDQPFIITDRWGESYTLELFPPQTHQPERDESNSLAPEDQLRMLAVMQAKLQKIEESAQLSDILRQAACMQRNETQAEARRLITHIHAARQKNMELEKASKKLAEQRRNNAILPGLKRALGRVKDWKQTAWGKSSQRPLFVTGGSAAGAAIAIVAPAVAEAVYDVQTSQDLAQQDESYPYFSMFLVPIERIDTTLTPANVQETLMSTPQYQQELRQKKLLGLWLTQELGTSPLGMELRMAPIQKDTGEVFLTSYYILRNADGSYNMAAFPGIDGVTVVDISNLPPAYDIDIIVYQDGQSLRIIPGFVSQDRAAAFTKTLESINELPQGTEFSRAYQLREILFTEGMVRADTLNIRSTPGTENEPIGRFASGDTVSIIGKNEDASWYRVVYEDSEGSLTYGWVSSQFIQLTNDAAPEAIPPTPIPDHAGITLASAQLVVDTDNLPVPETPQEFLARYRYQRNDTATFVRIGETGTLRTMYAVVINNSPILSIKLRLSREPGKTYSAGFDEIEVMNNPFDPEGGKISFFNFNPVLLGAELGIRQYEFTTSDGRNIVDSADTAEITTLMMSNPNPDGTVRSVPVRFVCPLNDKVGLYETLGYLKIISGEELLQRIQDLRGPEIRQIFVEVLEGLTIESIYAINQSQDPELTQEKCENEEWCRVNLSKSDAFTHAEELVKYLDNHQDAQLVTDPDGAIVVNLNSIYLN